MGQVRASARLWRASKCRASIPGVGQAGPGLGQHLLLILVHVHWVRPCGLGLGVWVNLPRPQPAGVVPRVVPVLLAHRHVQQLLVALQALGGGAAHDGGDGAPLAGHELGEVQQLFILLTGPLRLFDARV